MWILKLGIGEEGPSEKEGLCPRGDHAVTPGALE